MKSDIQKIASLEKTEETTKLPFDEVKRMIENVDFLEDKPNIFTFFPKLLKRIKGYYRRFTHRIDTLWVFAKLGWNDYDWDHLYLTKILEVKLQRMYDFFASDLVMSEDASKQAKKIKIALDACKRLNSLDYLSEELKEHDKKWGKLTSFTGPQDPITKRYPFKVSYENVKTEEDRNLEQQEFKAACERSEKKYGADSKLLFDTIKNNFRNWWD